LRVSERHAWRYISKLEAQGKIYLRYRQHLNFYALRRTNEAGQISGVDQVGPSGLGS
jgi:hypothetical protein